MTRKTFRGSMKNSPLEDEQRPVRHHPAVRTAAASKVPSENPTLTSRA